MCGNGGVGVDSSGLLTPLQAPAEPTFDSVRCFLGTRSVPGDRLVENDFSVDRDLEDPFLAGPQLDSLQDRRPPRSDLGCRTGSIIEIVSGNAVLDDHLVPRVDHALTLAGYTLRERVSAAGTDASRA